MGPYGDDDLLALSGVQHYAFCPRQWGLIAIGQLWAENAFTAQGSILHERAHNEAARERRGGHPRRPRARGRLARARAVWGL